MRLAALLRAARWLPLALALGGCAHLPFFGHKKDETKAEKVAAEPQVVNYHLEVVAPKPLKKLLSEFLDLARFQKTPQSQAIKGVELDRLVATTPKQARSLVETEGYFDAKVDVTRSVDAAGLAQIRVAAEPGPRTIVREAKVDTTGPIKDAAEGGNAAASAEIAALREAWPLKPGEPFRQPAWSGAKTATIGKLRADGYPSADWASTAAQVDADHHAANLAVVADSGPLYHFGPIDVKGINRYGLDAVLNLATFRPGDPYSEKELLDFQERIVKVGLFEGATVVIDPDPATAQAAPVHVRVRELKQQQLTLGIGYSANTGPRVTADHFHRRVFGQEWIAHSKFEFGPNRKAIGTELTSYPHENLWRNLASANYELLRSTDETRTSWTGRVGRSRDDGRTDRLYYAEALHSRVDGSSVVTSSDALSGNYNWILRAVDNVLLPTSGYTITAQSALGYGSGSQFTRSSLVTDHEKGPFARLYGRYTLYRPIGSWFSTVRVEAGEVFARSRILVPDPLLFRAGGDDSVRGYGYRSLGPTVNGTVVSGRVMATASAEIAHTILERYPAFLYALFVDAGDAADRWGDLSPVLGYGAGLRWRSPIGPVKLDLAYGQQVHAFRLGLTVGVTF